VFKIKKAAPASAASKTWRIPVLLDRRGGGDAEGRFIQKTLAFQGPVFDSVGAQVLAEFLLHHRFVIGPVANEHFWVHFFLLFSPGRVKQ
jgi:hypothetical protein